MTIDKNNFQFLSGGGEMANLTRGLDWSNHAMGSPDKWPQSLRTTLGIVLRSGYPMFLWWGPELTCFYNDAYRTILGENGKHPSILGMCAEKAWPEIWHVIKPLIDQVMAGGEATWSENQLIPIFRNGKIEDVYWTFSYTPVTDESGKVAGVLVICNETTDKVIGLRKIAESEERFRTMAESSDILIAVADENGKATYFNKAWVELTGRSMNDLLNGWIDLIHPDDRAKYLDIYFAVFKKQSPFTGEFRILNRKGTYTWLLAKGPPRFKSDGSFSGYISSCFDITELRETADALKASEERFRSLIMQSPISMAVFRGKEHVIEMANTAMALRWKNWTTDFLNKKLTDVFPGIEQKRFPLIMDEVYKTAKPYREVDAMMKMQEKDSIKTYYIDFEYSPLFEKTGKVSGIIATVNDVTEKVISRKKLEESEQRFRNVADSTPAMIWMSGIDKRCYFFNKEWLSYRGRTMEQEYGYGWAEGVHPEDLERCVELYNKAFDQRQTFYMEYRLQRHDGQYRWISDNAVARFTSDGLFEGYIGACMDIQEQKLFSSELEKQVSDRTAELERKNEELQLMNKELQSFAYISSHDLQEPLRKIQTFCARIMERELQNLSENGKDHLQRMNNAAMRMQTLIEDLLLYSRTTTAERKFENIPINPIISEVKDELKEEIQNTKAIVDVNANCTIDIIPFQFRQLLYNLLSNALKFTDSNRPPHITINARIDEGTNLDNQNLSPEKTYCHISISDNGIGFEPVYSERIFEVFQRLHGRSEFKGTGIGLSIVKKIVENHNGYIKAKGYPEEGATFDIFLPVSQAGL